VCGPGSRCVDMVPREMGATARPNRVVVVERIGGVRSDGPPAVVAGDSNGVVEAFADVIGRHDLVDFARGEALAVAQQHGVGGAGG